MTIHVVRRVHWKRPRKPRETEGVNRLSVEEAENVMAALRALHARRGGWKAVARAMRLNKRQMSRFVTGEAPATAGMAIRVAKVAGVTVDAVLSGEFARPEKCPMCGRLLDQARQIL